MISKEILKKAIEKARENKYVYTQKSLDYMLDYANNQVVDYYIKEKLYYPIIFSHDFAKAFWKQPTPKPCKTCGNEGGWHKWVNIGCHFGSEKEWETCKDCKGESRIKDYVWRMSLREMVTEEEPLKYLEKFL